MTGKDVPCEIDKTIEICAQLLENEADEAGKQAFIELDRARRWYLCDRHNIAREFAQKLRALKT